MAVVPMSKISILLHREYKQKVLELLQSKGVMQIVDTAKEVVSAKDYTEKVHVIATEIAEVEFALKFLEKYAPQNKGMEKLILGDKVKVSSLSEIDFVRQGFNYQELIGKCKKLEAEINRVKNKSAEIDLSLKELSPWIDLDLDLGLKRETAVTNLLVGEVEAVSFSDFMAEIEENTVLFESAIVAQDLKKVRFWLLIEKEARTKVASILQKYAFVEFLPSGFSGSVQEVVKKLTEEEGQLTKETELLKKEQKKLAKKSPELKIIFDYLVWQKEREKVKENLMYTAETVSIEGFLPKKLLQEVEQDLTVISNTVVLTEIALEEGETFPVDLHNKEFIRPFEGVIKLFGLPAAHEADPTPYLTPFFLVFFGFCLTDVGYGLILGLGLLVLLKTVKFPKDMQAMLKLLMYAGWSTVVMGILFGGYMGLTVEQAPAWMVNAETGRFKLQVFDPVNNIYLVMGLAYGIGLLHLWLGTFLKGMQQAKTSKWVAIQASFSYNLLLLLVIFLSLAKTGVLFSDFTYILEIAVYVNIIFSIWGSGHEMKNIFFRPFIGIILFIQEVINLFSGVLSYSRLFALGLSTGIIALVFNTIAFTALDLLPIFIAIPAMVIIIILGHLLNIALNVLGAFIHSARLQLVEFFGKFFEGGGVVFTPFKKEMKYISLEDK